MAGTIRQWQGRVPESSKSPDVGDERPVVRRRVQDEPDDAVTVPRRAQLAVRRRSSGSRAGRAAGPDDELADAARLVLAAGRVLGREPLVVVVVAVDDDVRAGRRRARPRTAPTDGVVAVLAGAEPRVMPDRQRAPRLRAPRGRPRASDPAAESGTAAADQRAVRVEHDHVPRPEVVRVPARAVRAPAAVAEVAEVAGEVLGLPVVVAGRRPGPVRDGGPRSARSSRGTGRRCRSGRRCRRR